VLPARKVVGLHRLAGRPEKVLRASCGGQVLVVAVVLRHLDAPRPRGERRPDASVAQLEAQGQAAAVANVHVH
jgi:hypothetical protein